MEMAGGGGKLMESKLLDLDHAIGYNADYPNTIHYHPQLKDTFLYNVGALVVIESINDQHNQTFLRAHDTEVSSICVSNNGIQLYIYIYIYNRQDDRHWPERLHI